MDLGILSIITGITFLLVFLNLLFAFTKSQEKVIHKKAGDLLPFKERELQYRNFVFQINP